MRSFNKLVAAIEPDARLIGARRLHGGVSADVYALDLAVRDGGERRVVARGHRPSPSRVHDAQLAAREFALLRALYEVGLPVPRPLLHLPAEERAGGGWLVVEFVSGTTEVAAAVLPDALSQMAEFLTRLHAVDVGAVVLPKLPAREDPVVGALALLPDAPWAPAARAALEARGRFVQTNRSCLLHGDFWPGNVLWDDGRLAAVLDWEEAAIGDPLCDLAGTRVELLWRYGPESVGPFTTLYASRAGLDLVALPIWDLFVTSAGLAFMGGWGLDPERERTMRARGLAAAEAASLVIVGGTRG
jgi:aminoglycoside phosphotransferase (APT) family kinase protein